MRKWVAGRITWPARAGLLFITVLLGATTADASLVTFELYATGVSDGVPVDPFNVTGLRAGSVIDLNIYAILHGAVANDGIVQVVGNLNDGERYGVGAFSTSSAVAYASGPGTQPGTQVVAPNGSREIGSESFEGQGASDAATGNTYFIDAAPGASSFIPVTGTPDSKGNLTLLLGTATYTVSAVNGTTSLYFFPHLRTDGSANDMLNQRFVVGGAQYELDGAGGSSTMGISGAFDFQPVILFTPEPGAMALGALVGVGLLLRRRRCNWL